MRSHRCVFRQPDLVELLHQVAERGTLRAARGAYLLLQLGLEVGRPRGADHDHLELLVMLDGRDHVVGPEHVLVHEVADRQIVGVVADRHHGDDLLAVEEQGQRALVDDRGRHLAALLVDAGDRLGQARIVRVREQQGLAQGRCSPISLRCVVGLS